MTRAEIAAALKEALKWHDVENEALLKLGPVTVFSRSLNYEPELREIAKKWWNKRIDAWAVDEDSEHSPKDPAQ